MPAHVIKRNGEVVDFETSRISNAIQKAVRATQSAIEPSALDEMVTAIVQELDGRFVELYPNVENIQDIIERELVKRGFYEVSKEFILYRDMRRREREAQRAATIEKSVMGKLTVKKADNRTVLFDLSRIKSTLKRASKGYEKEISSDLVMKEVINNIYDGITTGDIEKSLILATTAFIEKDPAYSFVAGKLFMQKLYKEVISRSITNDMLGFTYREAFVSGIKKGVAAGLLDKELLNYDLNKLSYALQLDRDDLFEFMGIQTLYERYFQKIENKRIELPQGFFMRVAMGLALNEKDKESKAIEFYQELSSMRFMSSTPTLFHAGTHKPQLSSCYLNTVEDDLGHIFKVYSDNAQLSKWSGGIGTDWTNIRSTGARIKSTNVESQGVIPFLKIANDVTAAINRSGKRRGATCVYLETWHLDIEEFLDLRKNTGDERRRTHDMNTANWIPDLFMKRIIADEPWTLFSPEEVPDLHHTYGADFEKRYLEYEKMAQNGKIKKHKVVSAKKQWKKMISMLFETGHPWITFKDPCNVRSPQDHVGVVHNSNLCTEITLNTSKDETAVCNLGSINLEKFIDASGKVDEDALARTVRIAVRMLDNVVDINYYPTIEAKNANMRHRPVGLGIMGIQDAFLKLDAGFDSATAYEFSDRIMEFIAYHAYLSSSELAKERGAYESFPGSKWDRGLLPHDTIDLLERERGVKIPVDRLERMNWAIVRSHIKQHGMRNSNVLAIAPTATISTIVGCYPCIEPLFKNIYVKANMSGEFTIVNAYLIEDLKKLNMWNNEMLQMLKYYDGNISMIAGIPDKLKEKYKEAFDIDPKCLIKHTALRSKWIDQSQSHNVFIKTVSGSLISEVYMYAWEMGLKTTYYLRTMGASQIEKSTLDASKFGFTQKREYKEIPTTPQPAAPQSVEVPKQPKLCLLNDPTCEACQ